MAASRPRCCSRTAASSAPLKVRAQSALRKSVPSSGTRPSGRYTAAEVGHALRKRGACATMAFRSVAYSRIQRKAALAQLNRGAEYVLDRHSAEARERRAPAAEGGRNGRGEE